MKRFFPLFLLGLVLALVGSVSVQAKTQSEKTLYVYIQNPSRGGTIQFASPAYKTVNMNGSNGATVKMEDYLYIGGILLDFETTGIKASTTVPGSPAASAEPGANPSSVALTFPEEGTLSGMRLKPVVPGQLE